MPYPPSPFPSKYVFDAQFPGNSWNSTLDVEVKHNCLGEDLECIYIGIYNWIFAIHMKPPPLLSCTSTGKKAPPDFGLENERTHCSQNTLSEPYHKMVNSIRSVFPARIKCRLLWFNFLHVRLIFANETVSHASIISILEPSINDVA